MNISHELKAPVSNINVLLETLYEYDEILRSKKRKEMIELGIKETNRLNNLINQFLYLKEDLSTDLFNLEELSFQHLLRDIDVSKSLLFFRKNFFINRNFYIYLEEGLVQVNKELYCNAILNLVENASKFTYGTGYIITEVDRLTSLSIESFAYRNMGRVTVVDNGVGITNGNSICFESKSRDLTNSLSMGVGVRAVNNILLFHNLILKLITYPNRGSKFFFDIYLRYK